MSEFHWKTWNENVWRYRNHEQTSDVLIVICAQLFNDLSSQENWMQDKGKRLYMEVGYFSEITDITDFFRIQAVPDALEGVTSTLKLHSVADLLNLSESELFHHQDLMVKKIKLAALWAAATQFIQKQFDFGGVDCKFTLWLIYSQILK